MDWYIDRILWNCFRVSAIELHWYLVRQQAITWANVDTYLCRHMVSLGHNELIMLILEAIIYLLEKNY